MMRNAICLTMVVGSVLTIGGLAAAQDFAPEDYGLQNTNYYFISSEEFVTNDPVGCPWTMGGSHYFYNGGSSGDCGAYAPIHLPEGALIERFMVIYRDNTMDREMMVYLRAFWYETLLNTRGYDQIGDHFTSSDDPDYDHAFVDVDPDHTVQIYPGNFKYRSYVVYAMMPDEGPAIALRGVIVQWKRQVSPAPAAATFADVPTGHPFFQFVEALVESGITAGCGGGNYCPDDPVTRGQMAVFLSAALGLHWAP